MDSQLEILATLLDCFFLNNFLEQNNHKRNINVIDFFLMLERD